MEYLQELFEKPYIEWTIVDGLIASGLGLLCVLALILIFIILFHLIAWIWELIDRAKLRKKFKGK